MSTKKPVKSAGTPKKAASKMTTSTASKGTAKTTDLPMAAVIRIAKASGAERVGSDGAELILKMTEAYIGKLAKEAKKLAAHGGRKTLKEEDVEMAAQNL